MALGDNGSRSPIVDTAGVDVMPPSTIDSVSIDGKVANKSGTRSMSPHADVDDSPP